MSNPKNIEWGERFKDPRWQRVRLEAMEAACFKCELCDDGGTTLNVHHSYYEKDKQPWEYPLQSLRCLCERCHEAITPFYGEFKRQLGLVDIDVAYGALGYLFGARAEFEDEIDMPTFGPSIEAPWGGHRVVGESYFWRAFSDFHYVPFNDIFHVVEDGKIICEKVRTQAELSLIERANYRGDVTAICAALKQAKEEIAKLQEGTRQSPSHMVADCRP